MFSCFLRLLALNRGRRVFMGQVVGGLWDIVQGKGHVRRACGKVFDLLAEKSLLSLSNLHVATLMVYSSMNKQFFSPHKEPPSTETIRNKIAELRSQGAAESMTKDQFYETVLEWIQKDLRVALANKVVLALLGAPVMAMLTKNAARRVPRIEHVVDKVPTPLVVSAYATGTVLLQDIRMD